MSCRPRNIATFQRNLEKTDEPLTEWQTYTLKSGEKLDQVAPRFGIALADLLRTNGLSGKIRLATGSTLLVPAGPGADDVESVASEPRLPQIIEPEPPLKTARAVVAAATADKHSSKTIKSAKGVVKETRAAGKDAGRSNGKMAKNLGSGTTKTVLSKPPTPTQGTKVAKAGNGRRS